MTSPSGRVDELTAGVRGWAHEQGALFCVGAACVGVFLFLYWHDGGYAPTDWLPLGVFFLALLIVMLATSASVGSMPRLVKISIGAGLAFAAWNALSIAWAQVRGIAWDGANRTTLYVVIFSLFAVAAWPRRTVALLLGVYVLGVAAVGAGAFFTETSGDGPGAAFIAGRLSVPIDYANANAGVALAAVWPALYLAARRESPALVRGLMLASAGALVDVALLAQSRTTIVAVPIVLAVYLAVIPARLRVTLAGALVVVVVAVLGRGLLDVYEVIVNGLSTETVVSNARRSLVLSTVVLFCLGTAWGALDQRVHVSTRVVRVVGGTLLVAVSLALAGVVVAALAVGDPSARVSRAWEQFQANDKDDYNRTHFTSGFGTNRYDLWRVAVLEFAEHPIVGIGTDNYAAAYLERRRTDEEPLYPHSLPLRVLLQTGIVGGVLFAVWLGSAFLSVLRGSRGMVRDARALSISAMTMSVYWLVQGSVDWFWEIPALAAPAVAALGLGARIADEPPAASRPPARGLVVAAVAGGVLVSASFVMPWLAAKEVERSAATWFDHPAASLDGLARARSLNPLSDEADVVAGVIARRLGDAELQREAFERARRRNPKNWYVLLELALLDSRGDHSRALARLAEARALNPREMVLARVERALRAGRAVDVGEIEQEFIDRASELRRAG